MSNHEDGPALAGVEDRADVLEDRLIVSPSDRVCKLPHSPAGWLRACRHSPCPICGRTTWCSVSADGAVAICMREQSGREIDCRGAGTGWLHHLADQQPPRRHRRRSTFCVRDIRDFGPEVADARRVMSAKILAVHAQSLRVPVDALDRLGAFPDQDRRYVLCFPMRCRPNGTIVGVRVRDPQTRRKWSWPGSRGDGLFIPELSGGGDLYLAEGPTDTAALLGLGLDAVGQPNATGGLWWLPRLAAGRDVIVVADRDKVGLRGAEQAVAAVESAARSTRLLLPPAGMKDIREWIADGASVADVGRRRVVG